MGAVYQVSDLRIPGKIWALKEMSDAALGTPSERAKAVSAFMQEARMLATFSHRNLPQVVDCFAERGRHYLVMDFVQGETLDLLLARSGRLPEPKVLEWAGPLCDVLHYLHSQSPPVIFRDLKPGNIMVSAQGELKLIDFGIARFFKPGRQSDTQPIGTEGYAPPEQYGRGQTDARSDVYSLGVTLHEMLTGHDPTATPFQLPQARHLCPDISPGTEGILLRATAVDPDQRFGSVAEMRQCLEAARLAVASAPGPPVPAAPPVPVPAALRPQAAGPPRRRAWRTAAALVLVLFLGGLLVLAAARSPEPIPPSETPTSMTSVAASTAGVTASSTAVVSASPRMPTVPAPSATATEAPPPTRTATPSPEPGPIPGAMDAAVQAVIWRYQDVKAVAMGRWQTNELNTVLREGALSTQIGSVNWLRNTNSRWQYELHSMTFQPAQRQAADLVRVEVTKVETGRFYYQGSSEPSTKQSYYRKEYKVWYDLKRIDNQWYIVNIDL